MSLKILCRYDPSGPHYVRSGWGKAFKAAGCDFRFWVPDSKSAFDAFSDFEPDIFLGTTYDMDRALVKCITARPEMKVGLFASAWGDRINDVDLAKYPIVVVSEQEKRVIEHLKQTTGKPDFVFIHVTPKFLEPTMGGWRSIGVEPLGILNAADIVDYRPATRLPELMCDVAFCGGYWGYKGRNLTDYIIPLCHPSTGLNVKIFGNKPWPVHSYLGTIKDENVRHLFNSATVCPNVSEPHSTDLGWDIVERPFKVMSAGGFCISDYVEEAREIFKPSQLIMCETPQKFRDAVQWFVEHPEERAPYIKDGMEAVLKNHTYLDRVSMMLNNFTLEEEAAKVMEAKSMLIKAIYGDAVHTSVYSQTTCLENSHGSRTPCKSYER